MAWLQALNYHRNDPARPDDYELRLVMASEVDDGFGGKTVILKAMTAAEALGFGLTLPIILKDINLSLSAESNRNAADNRYLASALGTMTAQHDARAAQVSQLQAGLQQQVQETQAANADRVSGVNALQEQLQGEQETVASYRAEIDELRATIASLKAQLNAPPA